MMSRHIGKFIIVIALSIEAYNLLQHKRTVNFYSENFQSLSQIQIFSQFSHIIMAIQEQVRILTVLLYFTSVFFIFTRSPIIKLLVVLGIILHTLILQNPRIQADFQTFMLFVQNISIIGGIIYLGGRENYHILQTKQIIRRPLRGKNSKINQQQMKQ